MKPTSKYKYAVILWFTIMFGFTTFVMPLAGWSSNKIDASQIGINLLLSTVLCVIVLYFGTKQIKKENSGNEKMG